MSGLVEQADEVDDDELMAAIDLDAVLIAADTASLFQPPPADFAPDVLSSAPQTLAGVPGVHAPTSHHQYQNQQQKTRPREPKCPTCLGSTLRVVPGTDMRVCRLFPWCRVSMPVRLKCAEQPQRDLSFELCPGYPQSDCSALETAALRLSSTAPDHQIWLQTLNRTLELHGRTTTQDQAVGRLVLVFDDPHVYPEILEKLRSALQASRTAVHIRTLPPATWDFYLHGRQRLVQPVEETDRRWRQLQALVPGLVRRLKEFQVQGVRFGLSRGGRVLFGDDMGLGKTVQAIALAACFVDEWPLLVVAPASCRRMWASALERWLPFLAPKDIHLIYSSMDRMVFKDVLEAKVVVTSYAMARNLSTHRKCSLLALGFKVVIVDESHTLACSTKANCSLQTAAILDLLRPDLHNRRAILLSGTPVLSKPLEMFYQVDALVPGLLGWSFPAVDTRPLRTPVIEPQNKHAFASSYLQMRPGRVAREPPLVVTSRYQDELSVLLSLVMIRRLKSQVLSELPPRWRVVVRLDAIEADAEHKKEISDKARHGAKATGQGAEYFLSALHLIGREKCKPAGQWLHDRLPMWQQNGVKVVIFAHHTDVMSRLEDQLIKLASHGRDMYIKLDGHVSACIRESRLAVFRSEPSIYVALVSITAGGQGIDLSVASVAVFVELPPQPGWMRQAEDRLHRQGQHDCVTIYVLLSGLPAEDNRWCLFSRAIEDSTAILNGKYAAETLDAHLASKTELERKAEEEAADADDSFLAGCVDWEALDCLMDEQQTSPLQLNTVWAGVSQSSFQNHEGLFGQRMCTVGEDIGNSSQLLPNTGKYWLQISCHSHRIHIFKRYSAEDTITPLCSYEPSDLDVYCNTRNTVARHVKGLELPRELLFDPDLMQRCLLLWQEWQVLNARERHLLHDIPLQPPLRSVLQRLKEARMQAVSLLRTVSLQELIDQAQLPLTSRSRTIVHPGNGQVYLQRISESSSQQSLCLLCDAPAFTTITTTQDLFCGTRCFQTYFTKCRPQGLRRLVAIRDAGVCEGCGLDCQHLLEQLRSLSTVEDRKGLLQERAPGLLEGSAATKLLRDPQAQLIWHCDHERAVYQGGGLCSQTNARTLCLTCHRKQTSGQAADRRRLRQQHKAESQKLEVPFSQISWEEDEDEDVWRDFKPHKAKRKRRRLDLARKQTQMDECFPRGQRKQRQRATSICVPEAASAVASVIVAQLLFLESEDPKKPISLYINSPGGIISSGLSVYDTMQYIQPEVSTICMGQACSMASLLLAAGAPGKRYALPHSRIMVHQPSGGAQGQASDIAIQAKEILNLRIQINELYASHTGQPIDVIENAMERDTFMSPTEAKKFGLIDSIITHRQPKPDPTANKK